MIGERKTIETVPLDRLKISRFNPRKARPRDAVVKLAARIKSNGFEITRAPWVYPSDDGFEIFAGGTRFRAAVEACLTEIPVVIHRDHTEEEIVRLADEDNENDEYHAPVPLLDQWDEYARLKNEEKWEMSRIAQAKGCDLPQVSRRISYSQGLPDAARRAVCDGFFLEGHCQAIMSLVVTSQKLSPWLTTGSARDELSASLYDKSRVTPQTVGTFREQVSSWEKLISRAEESLVDLGDEWGGWFVQLLAKEQARTLPKLNECFKVTLQKKHDAEKKKADDANKAKSEAERAAAEAKRQEEEAERIEEMTAKIVLGDALEAVAHMPIANLLLTDPPYGQDFQSGRRKATGKKKKIEADGDPLEAGALLIDVLRAAMPRLKDDAHVLVFTSWRHEPIFRDAIKSAGLEIKGSLVWVKNNHGTGDLKGSFAPKHERIIHAVKGKPEMAKRIPDVIEGKDKQDSDHPTEKPIDLLKTLIEATTHKLDTVADPFAGSGSTLFAALELERDFWGVEIDGEYHKKIQDELYRRATER